MNNKNLKKVVYGLATLFILIFLTGMTGVRLLFLIPLILYIILGITLIILTSKMKIKIKPKTTLLLTGLSSLIFSISIIYGVLGIWGFYNINDPIYLTSIIFSTILFIIGVIGSILFLKKQNEKKHPNLP